VYSSIHIQTKRVRRHRHTYIFRIFKIGARNLEYVHKITNIPAIVYGCESWPLTPTECFPGCVPRNPGVSREQ
jgi:hypothetical protein